jgi:hypothetical protein
MINENENFSIDSDEFLNEKKRSFKKLTKLGKRPYNKAKNISIKNLCKFINFYYIR